MIDADDDFMIHVESAARRIEARRRDLDTEELELVQALRLAGQSWDVVATFTGMNSRQAAHAKFSPLMFD